MSTIPVEQPTSAPPVEAMPSRGFWVEAWQRFRRRKLGMTALIFVVLLGMVALFAPAIAGTKPIVTRYKGRLYFPAMAYYNRRWENAIFRTEDKFRGRYPKNLKENDPESWAIWPLVYQDPDRRIYEDDWPGVIPPNPTGHNGKPYLYYLWLKGWDALFDTNRVQEEFSEEYLAGPPPFNLFGTTDRGVDVFAQMVHGAQTAMLVGFVSMGIAATIGISMGAAAGYFGGAIDIVLSRLIEVVMCIPSLVLILALLAIVERPSIWHIMAVLGVTGWTGIARLTRGEFLKLKQMEYVAAAKALGAGHGRLMFRHILRNALAPILVPIAFGIASAILTESALSFLGFGDPTAPSWGDLLSKGRDAIREMWWLILFPGMAIFLTVLAYNLIGEGLQEATDPRLRQAGH
ncbi:MAG: ABC transporter permease [Planctomycetes bacterium]|nr:ABC transporter permease [Planctomycetota bacterium]